VHSLNTPTDSYLFLEHLFELALSASPRLRPERAEYLLDRCLQRLDDGVALEPSVDYRELWRYAHAS